MSATYKVGPPQVRAPTDVTDDEYANFFKSLSKDFDAPLDKISLFSLRPSIIYADTTYVHLLSTLVRFTSIYYIC